MAGGLVAGLIALAPAACGGGSDTPSPTGTAVTLGGAVGTAHPSASAGPRASSTDGNPFDGAKLYVDPTTPAAQTVNDMRSSDPRSADLIARIAGQPLAYWVSGTPVAAVKNQVSGKVQAARATGALPLLVAYNIPGRDCAGGHSGGGAAGAGEYQAWINQFAAGLGTGGSVVILEPDAIAGADCLNHNDQAERFWLLDYAVKTLGAHGADVYLDGGNSHWKTAQLMAERLKASGVANARGFALNVSNFNPTSQELAYGDAIDAALGQRAHFVVDTSRNGLGPAPGHEWCNPAGRALGHVPTVVTSDALADALLWVKRPGESDGTCNGGPAAGQWWTSYAVGLVERATG